jgi:hypothetical protein
MQFPKQRRWRNLLILSAVALVGIGAATTITLQRGQPAPASQVADPAPPIDRPDVPTLPPYIMNMAGGDIDINAADPKDPMGPPVIANPGARLEFSVRGELEVKIRVHVKLFWRMKDRLARWQPSVQYGPFSTYRYRGSGEAPFGPGRGDLVAIVSPFADIPDVIHAAWLSRPPRHWQILRQPVVWQRAAP